MKIVVSDANIIIDLVKLHLVENLFGLNFEFHIPKTIFDNELGSGEQAELLPYIEVNRLQLFSITTDQMREVRTVIGKKPGLSVYDGQAYVTAKVLGATLLTSDKLLRTYANDNRVEVHGHLYILDELVAQMVITPIEASEKLNELQVLNTKLSLPLSEIRHRLERWTNRN